MNIFKKNRNFSKKFFDILVLASFLFVSKTQAAILSLTDTGTGIDRVVTIESSGQFRLVFEAADNWGISGWYDLVNDPLAQTNLAFSSISGGAAEPGLFQQVFYGPPPVDDNKLYMMAAKVYQPNGPRSFDVIENTSSRIVVEAMSYPIIGTKILDQLKITIRYYIYPDGKIYLKSITDVQDDLVLNGWRSSVIGLNDPAHRAYSLGPVAHWDTLEANSFSDIAPRFVTDTSKNWTDNQWVGYKLGNASGTWVIDGNTSNTIQVGARNTGVDSVVGGAYYIDSLDYMYGWIRGTETQTPYRWTSAVSKYLFEFWDPATPAPYTNWTKASIMLVPKTGNPYFGKQNIHSWSGFKRFYYEVSNLNHIAGQSFTQEYLMQLGSQNSSVLPNITSAVVADSIANAYLADPTPPGGTIDKKYLISDFTNLISQFLKIGNTADLNFDNFVNTRDLGIMMSKWQ